MMRFTDRMSRSYSSRTSTLPRNSRLIARCHEITLIGSNPWLSSKVCALVIEKPGANVASAPPAATPPTQRVIPATGLDMCSDRTGKSQFSEI